MKLETLHQWLALAANFGVVAGLIFVGIQVQKNTTALQAAAVPESTNVARQQLLTIAADPELNRLLMQDYDSLTSEDQRRVFWLDRSF